MQDKKGDASQVFIYITAMVIFAVVFIFGYSAIRDFMDKGEKVAFVTFKTDLESTIRKVATDYGSVTIHNARNPLRVSGAYKKVCFVNLDKEPDCGTDLSAVACDAWETAWDSGQKGYAAADANVFLEPPGLNPIKVYQFVLDTNNNQEEDDNDDGYYCFPIVAGRLDVRIEGGSGHAIIGPVKDA